MVNLYENSIQKETSKQHIDLIRCKKGKVEVSLGFIECKF